MLNQTSVTRSKNRQTFQFHVVLMCLIVFFVMSGCSAFVPLVEPAAAPASETTAEDAARPAQEAAAPAPAESQAEAEEADDSWVKPADSSEAAPTSSGTDTVAEPVPFKNEQQRNGLNAGEVDDNEKWDDYLSYRRN
jgi:hypothetical protein